MVRMGERKLLCTYKLCLATQDEAQEPILQRTNLQSLGAVQDSARCGILGLGFVSLPRIKPRAKPRNVPIEVSGKSG